ncbi:MAG TPA: T9SS type A sorting domain-containing protein [Caldithrix sp.]|nr:T9SS type A sorting domain-containing protein [Caldithrix sp.]
MLKAKANATAEDFIFLVIQDEQGSYSKVPASRVVSVDGSQNMPVLAYSAVNGHLTGEQYLSFDILAKPRGEAAEIYPQPLVLSRGNPFLHFDHLPAEAIIYIFSSNGKYLQTLRTESNERSVSWNLVTKDGEMAGSGVYLYRIESPGEEKTGKFVLVR